MLCFCRAVNGISDKDVEKHVLADPARLLGHDWDLVSFDMTDKAMECGRCEDEGNACLQRIEAQAAEQGIIIIRTIA